MISYNDIYESARKERYSEQLQDLPKNFVSEVAVYLKDKKEVSSREDDEFSDVILKTKKQLENARTLFNELMRLRRKKILSLVLIAAETGISKRDFENMLQSEKELFEELMKCIDANTKKLGEELNGREKNEHKNELVAFKRDVDEFVGLNGEKIGPFEKGQIANLQKEVAKILVDDGLADVVEER